MQCAYLFALLSLLGFPALSLFFGPFIAIYVVWFSQTFLQLIFLPIITVGQNVLGRKQELHTEEMYHTTIKSFTDIEQIAQHLLAQDAELLEQTSMLVELLGYSSSLPSSSGSGAIGVDPKIAFKAC